MMKQTLDIKQIRSMARDDIRRYQGGDYENDPRNRTIIELCDEIDAKQARIDAIMAEIQRRHIANEAHVFHIDGMYMNCILDAIRDAGKATS